MRKYLFATILMTSAASVFAADSGFNSDAYLAANPDVRAAGYTAYQHINMISGVELAQRLESTAALVAKANGGRDVKIMFCDCTIFTESSVIQDSLNWQMGSANGKTTTKAMVQTGWRVQNTVSLNARQFYIVFVK